MSSQPKEKKNYASSSRYPSELQTLRGGVEKLRIGEELKKKEVRKKRKVKSSQVKKKQDDANSGDEYYLAWEEQGKKNAEAAIRALNIKNGVCVKLVKVLGHSLNTYSQHCHINFIASLPGSDSPKCFFAEVDFREFTRDEDRLSFCTILEGDSNSERLYCTWCSLRDGIRHPIDGFRYGVPSKDYDPGKKFDFPDLDLDEPLLSHDAL